MRLLLLLGLAGSCVDLSRPAPTVVPVDGGSADRADRAPTSQDVMPADGISIDERISPPDAAEDAPADTNPGLPQDAPEPDVGLPADGPYPGLARGESCTSGGVCASGFCADGVCCNSACSATCFACNLPASAGTCAPEPATTICAPAACSGGVLSSESRCDGAGLCVAGSVASCSPYACAGTACGSGCTSSAGCAAAFTCTAGLCVSAGLLVHWRFDETSGNTVADSSGNGRTGTLIGLGTSRPQPSTMVAPVRFANPRSLELVAAQNHGVVASPIPASIKANPELTVAAWFRATIADPDGSALVNLSNDFSLRLESDRIEWIKRKGTTAGQIYALATWVSPKPLDGRWHHVAASSGAAGLRLYFDGMSVATVANTDPPIFSGPDQIAAGHQPGDDVHELDGQIDDVRIYGRVLTPADVANLAAGNP